MTSSSLPHLAKEAALNDTLLENEDYIKLITDSSIDLLDIISAAYEVRKKYFEKVHIHIINNAQNGSCPEDCNYWPKERMPQQTFLTIS